MPITYGAFTEASADALLAQVGSGLPACVGTRYYVNGSTGSSTYDGQSPDKPKATIAQAVALCVAGDQVVIAPGDYDEAVTITTAGICLVGAGNPGQVAVAPSATNATAITVTDADDVAVVNVGCGGNGTGGGLLVQSDSSRFRVSQSKLEGGAYAVKLLGDASASPADIRITDCELCWATVGVNIDVGGGGDPCTQVLIARNLLHNITTDGVLNNAVHTADLWVLNNVFAAQEDGTETTQYLDIDAASTTGLVANNIFQTTVIASSTLAIATGVLFINNRTEAEQPGTNAFATNGRPD